MDKAAYVVEEEATNPAKNGSVDGRYDSSQERPLPAPVMGDRWIGMVKEGTHHCNMNTVNLLCHWLVRPRLTNPIRRDRSIVLTSSFGTFSGDRIQY